MRRASVARIDEPRCIGCTRCIDACPVDAISGANGFMHAVIAHWCIGCKLCVPPCPVDCIDMVAPRGAWTASLKRAAGARARRRTERLKRDTSPRPASAEGRRKILEEILARRRR